MCIDTERENGSSINFIFTLLPSPALDKMYCLLHCSSQENDAAYDVLIYSDFFVNGKFTESFHFCMFWPIFFCFTHVSLYLSVRFCLSTVTLPSPLIFGSSFFMSVILGGLGGGGCCFIFRNAHFNFLCMVGLSIYCFHLLTFRSQVQLQSSYSIILALFVH